MGVAGQHLAASWRLWADLGRTLPWPRPSLPCRYSAFIPLYPVGVAGEVLAIVGALPAVRAQRLHSVALPNAWNAAFDYGAFLQVLYWGVLRWAHCCGLGSGRRLRPAFRPAGSSLLRSAPTPLTGRRPPTP